jgi:O-antigen ligase
MASGSAATLSLDPGATGSALLTGVALALLLLVAADVAARRGVRRLALALLVSAGFQGLYGVLVLISGHDRIWYRIKPAYLDAATGSFINKNHFAGFLAMALACGMGLILANAARRRSRPGGARLGARLGASLGADGSRNLVLVLLLAVGVAGLLTSFSRAGIVLGLAALLATLLLGAPFLAWRVRLPAAAAVIAVALVPLLSVGSQRLVQRFADSQQSFLAAGGRARVWLDTLDIVAAYPLTGTGFGTFAAVYPLYRSPEVRLYYAHAHNDWIQFIAEGGLLGLVALGVLAVPVLRALSAGLRGRKGITAVGVAAGLCALILHGCVDFNLHIPANAATGAVLAGALVGLPCRRA